jgi:hypothetical protein
MLLHKYFTDNDLNGYHKQLHFNIITFLIEIE